MQDSAFLPDLRILPVKNLLAHEEFDPRRIEKLARRFKEDGIIKHPPITAQIECSDQFVILDGANRVMAFDLLHIPHIVAQVVDYATPGLVLDTWYHVVAGMPIDRFNHELTQATGMHLEPSSLAEARLALAEQRAAAYIVCEEGVRQVCNTNAPLQQDIGLLNRLVKVYKGQADIFRASNDIWEIQKPYYPKITALVIFPRLKPADIIQAACSGEKIPTGISRHVIPARALNVNIPLWILEMDCEQEKKEAWLHDWLMERMASNAIRYYAESTFSFNE
jgi:hypothetical protein